MISALLDIANNTAPVIIYHGWDVVDFWLRQMTDWFHDFSWQVRTAYFILLMNIVTIILLSIIFGRNVYRHHQAHKMYENCDERFREAFNTILASPYHWSISKIENECGCTVEDFKEFDGNSFSQLICSIRLENNEKVYLPNVQILCELTGVRSTIEENLKRGIAPTQNLQLIMTLPLRISEGRLAVYTNYRDSRIRSIARLCLVLCTESDPFRYLVDDLNGGMAAWQFISLHRLHGWLAATNRQLPPFLSIAHRVTNERSSAFMISEVAYWGTEIEQKSLSDFFMHERPACRKAAMKAVAKIHDISKEEELIATYRNQPGDVQMEILRTITALNTGHQASFLEKCYITAPSKDIAELALSCLYNYGEGGRHRFEALRHTPLDRHARVLLDQIESMGQIGLLRNAFGTEAYATLENLYDHSHQHQLEVEDDELMEPEDYDVEDGDVADATLEEEDDTLTER